MISPELSMNLPISSCSLKRKEWKADESSFKHNQDVVMPGFRFHPTEEELVEFYLRRKVEGKHFNIEVITTVDLYRYDPWELPALASNGEKELFFYVHRDRKYRNGDRPNRVTKSGYWKATGADRMVHSEVSRCIGLKKTLVFYTGKAPKGKRTSWIMTEYRLPQLETHRIQKNELSLCRVRKRSGKSEEGGFGVKEHGQGTETDRTTVNKDNVGPCLHIEMQESGSMHQWQTCMACNNIRTTVESCNLEIRAGSTHEIVKLEELPADIKVMPNSVSGEDRNPAQMKDRVTDQSEHSQECIYSRGGNICSRVRQPISVNDELELSLTTSLICPREQDLPGMTKDLYNNNNNPSSLVLTNALTDGACLQTFTDKLWEWNPVRSNGSGASC